MRFKSLLICVFLMVPAFVHSQTAQTIEDLLDSQAVSNQQAAWLVLEAANVPGISSQADAFHYAAELNWLPTNVNANDRISFDQLSLLIMRAFDMKGGIFFSLVGSPHYAYRELVYRNIILGRVSPRMAVSGYNLLYVVNRVLSFQEAELL